MGQTFKWYCEKCDYSALVSGGTDRGFYSFKNTYICSNCETIMDLSLEVSENGEPIERVIFYPFAFFINKHIEFILVYIEDICVSLLLLHVLRWIYAFQVQHLSQLHYSVMEYD